MRKDTKTFLSTVLGIPLILGGVWSYNAANDASVMVFQREYTEEAEPAMPELVELPKEEVSARVAPVAPAKKPVATTPRPEPVVVPVPVTVPVVTTPPPPVEPAPKPVVVKKSRRTRAS